MGLKPLSWNLKVRLAMIRSLYSPIMFLGMHTYPRIYLSTFLLLCQSDITIFISLTLLFLMVLGIDPKDLCRLSQHAPVLHALECKV